MYYGNKSKPPSLKGLKVSLVGFLGVKLTKYTRALTQQGALVSNVVTANADVVFIGDYPRQALNEAVKYGTPIKDERCLQDYLKGAYTRG